MGPAATDDSLLADLLDALDGAAAASMLDVAFLSLRKRLPLRSLWLYVADYGEETLRAVPGAVAPPPPTSALSVRGTLPGRVYLSREATRTDGDGGPIVWVPLFRQTDSIGVLAFPLEREDPRVDHLAPAVALAIGASVLGARRHSDTFELARGARELRLAAALQWDLLPLPTYQDPWVEVAGRIEPAYDIGGDAFDFAANRDRVEIAVFDAMGHGVRSTLLTTLAVGAYRFSRRRSIELSGIAGDIDEAVRGHTGGEAFVTGHLCRLELDSGTLGWVNVGHPVPILVRDHAASPLGEAAPVVPFGLHGKPQGATEIALQPQDIVLFYSDGLIEARRDGGPEFGMERFLDMATRHGDAGIGLLLLVRNILDAVSEHADKRLRDDATLVAMQWSGARALAND